jgi:histidine ammonia-lyase
VAEIDVVRQKTEWLGGGGSSEDRIRTFIEGHCAGVGDPMPQSWVRALMATRANTLAGGHSGVRPAAVDVLLSMLYADVIPVVPLQGSVGAAGNVALAHVARVACGFGGEAWRRGRRLPADKAMKGLPKLRPTEKEALSLINGSALGTALASLAVFDARRLMFSAESACALSMEVVRADSDCLSELALDARRHPGVAQCGERLRRLVSGSELVTPQRKPDPFSIRCAPVVFGAAWDALHHVEEVVTRELNAAVDNPLVFPAIEVVEVGNFHGAPVAMAMDHLKVVLTQVASMAERRIYRLTYGALSGLPSFLLPDSGVNSGLMLAQYTAASLVSECKGLAHPASVDSIPTVQHHEDHISMAPVAARGALEIVDLLSDVLAIELMCGAQGLDFHLSGEGVDDDGQRIEVPPRAAGVGSAEIHKRVRRHVARWIDDRVLHTDLRALGLAVRQGEFAEHPV